MYWIITTSMMIYEMGWQGRIGLGLKGRRWAHFRGWWYIYGQHIRATETCTYNNHQTHGMKSV